MKERMKFRLYLLLICIISFTLAIIGLATAFLEVFLVFYSLCAYAYIMLFWNEYKK